MKTIQTVVLVATALLFLASTPLATAQTEIPAAINYQGKLTDDLGDPLTNGYYVVEFRIWKDPTLTGASELAWGRSFPVHVVEGGLFNVLLTDDGAIVDGLDTEILSAFGGPERYLGLTIAQDPNGVVTSPDEISPRQRLVSAPYTIQAQMANSVATDGVSTTSLANGSVTTDKIAANAVTSGSIANNAVTTAKIAAGNVTSGTIASGAVDSSKIAAGAVVESKITAGAVTSSKLNIDADFHMNDNTLFLRGGSDTNHGLGHAFSFGNQSFDGPALFGFGGGVLGTTQGGEKAALSWKSDGSVAIRNGPVSIIGSLEARAAGTKYTASTDGFIIYFGYRVDTHLNWWKVGNNTATPDISVDHFSTTSGADTYTLAWPVAKGEQWQFILSHQNSGGYSDLHWRPLGQ